MKIIFLLGLFIAALHADYRLIQFNETTIVRMTLEEVEKLSKQDGPEIHFMDITDYPQPYYPKPRRIAIPDGPTHQTVVRPILNLLSSTQITSTIQTLSAYTTRYYTSPTGVQAANWLVQRYRSIAGNRQDIVVEGWAHSWAQPSVIAKIIGSTHPQEKVIIGGHIDSTSSGARAPGADDDASGSSTVLEVFRVIVEAGFFPERTLEFHGYAAEEVGLRGSQDIANSYYLEDENVVAMLQLDMTGYIRPGTSPTIGVVTDFTDATLTRFVRACIDEYAAQISWSNTACGYGCSDHASWTRAGYPSAFAFESLFSNSNPNIHTVNDVPSLLNPQHALEFARLGLAFAVELSFED